MKIARKRATLEGWARVDEETSQTGTSYDEEKGSRSIQIDML